MKMAGYHVLTPNQLDEDEGYTLQVEKTAVEKELRPVSSDFL